MDFSLIIFFSLSISLLIKLIYPLLLPSPSPPLPPGPPRVPLIGSLLFLQKPFSELKPILRNLNAKYGPIFTLPIGPRSAIFISDPSLAHQALIQNGVVFSNRPKSLPTSNIFNSNQHNISSSFYGPTWLSLRRNLTHNFLNPAGINSFSGTRKWDLNKLLDGLKSESELSGKSTLVIDHLRRAMSCLLVTMCFGDGLSEKEIKEIEDVHRRLMLKLHGFTKLNFFPSLTRVLCHKSWEELYKIRKEQKDVLIPLIRARKLAKGEEKREEAMVSYVATLFDLELPEEKRKLNEDELVSICSEVLMAGTDTTATALEWILANLVKKPEVQKKLVNEIREVLVVGEGGELVKNVKEEDLMRMPYLKAVVLEGLRRHPPGHFTLPHAVSEDTVLNGYLMPKNGTISFMVAQIGLNPEVWEDPMEFKPERFLVSSEKNEVSFDLTGRKEIKMMPFGVGRRMCPGYVFAMLHLEYFVANLVWGFEWKASNEVDLSEKQELSVVMKNPLQANLSPRF